VSETALRRVLAVVVVLGAVYLGVRWFGAGEEGGTLTDDPVTARVLEPARQGSVTAVRIRRPDLDLDVARGSDGWRVNRYGADTVTVGHFLRSLRGTEVRELVSRNPRNHPEVGVASDSSWTLRVAMGPDTTPLLHVGREGPYDGSLFARLDGDDRVYLLHGELRSALAGELVQWREKVVVAVDTSEAAGVDVRRPDGVYRLRRDGGAAWTLDGAPTSSRALSALLEGLHQTRAYAFAGDTGAMGEPIRSVEVLDARGDTLAWMRAAPAAAGPDWLARSSRGDGAVFRVAGEVMDRITPHPDSLRPDAGG
jgi:hypothetical protein